MPNPTEIRYDRNGKLLAILFEDGSRFELPAEFLRVESPSAEVRGHSPDQRVLVTGKRHVGINRILPVGHYAVRLEFDDGHDSGIYSWTYLFELGREQRPLWTAYLDRLTQAGLSRDP